MKITWNLNFGVRNYSFIFLEKIHIHLFPFCLWLLLHRNNAVKWLWQRLCSLHSLNYLLSGPYQTKQQQQQQQNKRLLTLDLGKGHGVSGHFVSLLMFQPPVFSPLFFFFADQLIFFKSLFDSLRQRQLILDPKWFSFSLVFVKRMHRRIMIAFLTYHSDVSARLTLFLYALLPWGEEIYMWLPQELYSKSQI